MYLVDTWTKTLLGTVHASDCSLALLAERGSGGVGGALGGGDDGKSGAQDLSLIHISEPTRPY